MPLPETSVARTPVHTRAVSIHAFRRDDGNWDLEAELSDVKPHDLALQGGLRVAGDPVHHMHLRVTIDPAFCVIDALVVADRVAYPGYCESVMSDYRALIGLNLMKGFRRGLQERLGGVAGCTHVSELAQFLPTAAIQAMAGSKRAQREEEAAGRGARKPFQLDRCHAMRTDGEAVRLYYPKWFAAAPAEQPQPVVDGG